MYAVEPQSLRPFLGTLSNHEPSSPSPVTFRTDNRHVYQGICLLGLLGAGISTAAWLRADWAAATVLFSVFSLLTVGMFLYVRRRILGRHYVITADGISAFRGEHLAEELQWSEVARIDSMNISAITHDGRRITFVIPRTQNERV